MRKQLTIGVFVALAVSAVAASASAQEQIGPALVGETELGENPGRSERHDALQL